MSIVQASSYSWFENDGFYKKRHLFFGTPCSQRRRVNEQVKNEQICRVSPMEKMGKDHPMVPPLDHFQ